MNLEVRISLLLQIKPKNKAKYRKPEKDKYAYDKSGNLKQPWEYRGKRPFEKFPHLYSSIAKCKKDFKNDG